MTRKLIPFVGVALLGITTLAACGGGNLSSSFNPDDEGDIQRDENNNIIYDNVQLKMWSVTTGDDANTQDDIVEAFNTLYDGMIHVETVHYSRYDLESLLNTTMQFDQENAPDMLFNHGMHAAEYKQREWIVGIEDYFEKAGTVLDQADFVPSLLDSVTLDNDLYGLPIDCHSAMVEIRTDILEKNGFSIPTNYQELVDVSVQAANKAANNELWIRGENSQGLSATTWRKATTAETYHAFPISYGDMWVHEFFDYTAIVQNGGAIVDDQGMPAWNSAASNSGLQVLRDWIFPTDTSVNASALSQDYGTAYDVGDEPFRNGSAIFKLNGPWVYQKDLAEFERSLKSDGGSANITTRSLSNLLALDASKPYANLIKGEGHALMLMNRITSLTKACASTLFMDYMAYFNGIEWAKRGHIPAAISVSKDSAYRADPAYSQYIQYWGQPEDYVVVPPTEYYSYVDTYFKGAVQKVMSSSYQNQTVSAIVQEEYDDCLAYIQLYS